MAKGENRSRELVYTVKNRCRVCYTCVRECPAKAIRIINGQAEVMHERCIGCGNCTKVCSQGAKMFLHTYERVEGMLATGGHNIAIIAPSFPAEFEEISDHRELVAMIRALGFDVVSEVAFGADLVAAKYSEILKDSKMRWISSDCPAIVSYIERYHPDLVANLAPIASPMVAMTRVMREKYGTESNVVFIGPCLAKKAESDEVDEMITFTELRELFSRNKIVPHKVTPVEFDPPLGGKGAVFPVSRGLLQTAGIKDDVFDGDIIVAEGRMDFQEAIKEFQDGLILSQNLELLCCEGCIMGPGMTGGGRQYARRILVNNYVQYKIDNLDVQAWQAAMDTYLKLDLTVSFETNDNRINPPSQKEIDEVLARMGKKSFKDYLNCGACGYDSCEEHAIAIVKGLAEVEMCLPYTIEKLHNSVKDLAVSNEKLVTIKQALKQSEKMASMGQLSAGIAHELNNPLGVVIMYANILLEEADKESPLYSDLKLIVDQTNRCKSIVGGLLNFARKNQVNSTQVDVVKMVQQGLDAVIIPEQVDVSVIFDDLRNRVAELDHEQMLQIFTNLYKNAVDAMPQGGKLTITLEDSDEEVRFCISDTGTGIKEEDKDKIFEPFYTTKGIGKGTGLGLATAYGIIKMHRGKIHVDSNADKDKGPTGTTFKLMIPRNR